MDSTPRLGAIAALPDTGRPAHTMPLRRHMVLLVLIAVLPIGLISGVFVAQHAGQERRDFGYQLIERAATVALALDREIEVITTALAVMATTPALRDANNRSQFRAPARAVEAALGNVLVLHEPEEADRPDTPAALRAVFAEGRPGIGRPSERGAPMVPGLPVFEPVVDAGRTIVVLEMGLTESQISTVLASQNHGRDRLALMLDPQGTVTGAAGRGAPAAGTTAPAWLRLPPGSRIADTLVFGDWPDGQPRVCAFGGPARARNWTVAVCALREAYDAEWLNPLRERGLTLLGSLLLGIIVATAAARRFVHPLERLTWRARAVASHREEPIDVPASAVTEFEALRVSVRDAETALRRQADAEHLAMLEARTAQRLLASVINGVTESIAVKDLTGRYVLLNEAARRDLNLGLAQDAQPENPVVAGDATVIATGGTRSFEYERRSDGVARQFALTKAPWRDATGAIAGVLTVARDVTEARMHEVRLRSLQAELLRTTRLSSMGAMATGLAHEINQPLAAAANFLGAGLRMFDRAGGDKAAMVLAREAIEDAKAQVLRAGTIVRRLRDFVARGEAELRAEDVRDVIDEALALAQADGADGGIAITVEVAPDSGSAMIDRTQIQQVLLNLIRNAAESIASRRGGATTGDAITLSARRAGLNQVEIAVSDTGPGIAPAIARRLFQPFVSSKADGLGIGLAICHTIVIGHGGQLVHDATAAGCTRFKMLLPQRQTSGELSE